MKLSINVFIIPVILFLVNPLYGEILDRMELKSEFEQKYNFLTNRSETAPVIKPPNASLPVGYQQNQDKQSKENLRAQIAELEKLQKKARASALQWNILGGIWVLIGLVTLTDSSGQGGIGGPEATKKGLLYIILPLSIGSFVIGMGKSKRARKYARKIKLLQKELAITIGPSLSNHHAALCLRISF